MLTVEDARVLVDLLKLAVANRSGRGEGDPGSRAHCHGESKPRGLCVCVYTYVLSEVIMTYST